jgi:hypothetical protein
VAVPTPRTWAPGFVDHDDLNAEIRDPLNYLLAPPVEATVTTSQTTASTSYTDLATVGPTVASINLEAGQSALVIVSCRSAHSTGGGGNATYMSFAVSGAETDAASDDDAIISLASTNTEQTSSRPTVYTAGTAGAHTFQAKYKITNPGTGTFRERRLIVKPM